MAFFGNGEDPQFKFSPFLKKKRSDTPKRKVTASRDIMKIWAGPF
jgi:hypothetical protein